MMPKKGGCMMKSSTKYIAVVGLVCLFLMTLGGVAVAAKKVIHVWHTETNPLSREAIANIVTRFEAQHPDIKVEAEALAWGDLEGKIMAALAAGSPPELSHGQPITCAALQTKGLLLPLDEVVEAIGEDTGITIERESNIVEAEVVPEPATMFLFGFGLFGILVLRKRFRKR